MAGIPDSPTVTADGRLLVDLPQGVVLRPLTTHLDERGALCELYDPRWGVHEAGLQSAYFSTIRPGYAKGWALHEGHDDRYAIVAGRIELVLYDPRPDSPTSGLLCRFGLGETSRTLITIPAGVWHAERNIGDVETLIVNFPTALYDHERPDKVRLPLDSPELPDLGPGWRGW